MLWLWKFQLDSRKFRFCQNDSTICRGSLQSRVKLLPTSAPVNTATISGPHAELMQTELHHIQTLTVMSEVFRRGMVEELQLDLECVAKVFPCLDPLLLFHRSLFGAMQDCKQAAAQPENPRNYLIQQIGDVLLQQVGGTPTRRFTWHPATFVHHAWNDPLPTPCQFSDENAEKMKQLYGEFCSHHTEAVNVFKELKQQNKKLQNFAKVSCCFCICRKLVKSRGSNFGCSTLGFQQQSNNSLVRRRGVPEFILLVTQRITKYPVLLERILQYTQGMSA